MTECILVLNAGSSSIKFALYLAATLAPTCKGEIDGIGRTVQFKMTGMASDVPRERIGTPPANGTHDALTAWLLQSLPRGFPAIHIAAAGHRVVHGGQTYADPIRVTPAVIKALEQFIPLAPNHQPHNLAPISAIAQQWPGLPQVACFDTAFHRSQPRMAQLFALPRRLSEEGILRYGFHGLSYDYIAGVLPEVAGPRAQGRVIVAHLGHGASMCAMKDGRSVGTTMGFTAIDGLVMGTRCGSLDPGVILHLLKEKRLSAGHVANLLNNQSGLLGVSGISDDVRDLEMSSNPAAKEALDLFAYRAVREIGSLAAALGGLDVLVFTAGIGEHSAAVRKRICAGSDWLGIRLDALANEKQAGKISTTSSTVDVFVIPTDEEIVIARSTKTLVSIPPEGTV